MQWADKVALVMGGGSGIGRATCEIFAERGGAVAVADIDEKAARAVAEAIRARGGKAAACPCDVSRWEQVEAAVGTARRVLGRLDVVINCAGILRSHRLEETSEDEWNEVLSVNLTGAFLLTKAAMRALREQGGGAIVHIASRMAIRVKEENGAYAASKAGILSLTRMAALEGAQHGIRVNCVCPGFIDTPMTRTGYNDDAFVGWNKVCPLGRPGRPDDIAKAMLFLASEEASFITGVTLPVDGGRTIL
jgi:NAD(P)-dependent dehydrogenase (short-subunit alcohol dehydrogenase family)